LAFALVVEEPTTAAFDQNQMPTFGWVGKTNSFVANLLVDD
jgi:hypothetical protein